MTDSKGHNYNFVTILLVLSSMEIYIFGEIITFQCYTAYNACYFHIFQSLLHTETAAHKD